MRVLAALSGPDRSDFLFFDSIGADDVVSADSSAEDSGSEPEVAYAVVETSSALRFFESSSNFMWAPAFSLACLVARSRSYLSFPDY